MSKIINEKGEVIKSDINDNLEKEKSEDEQWDGYIWAFMLGFSILSLLLMKTDIFANSYNDIGRLVRSIQGNFSSMGKTYELFVCVITGAIAYIYKKKGTTDKDTYIFILPILLFYIIPRFLN